MKLFPLLLLIISLGSCTKTEPGIRPSLTTITEAVYGTATVVPKESYTVYSPVNGIIDRSHLEEGAVVDMGDELFRIGSQQAELERKKARQLYISALDSYQGEAAILQEMEERLMTAKLGLVNDSINYERQSRLWRQNIGSKQAFETMELKFRTAKNTVRELQRAYARTRRELANQVDLASTALEISGQRAGEYVTRAEIAGTIYEVLKEVGESVTTQTAVARIGSTNEFVIELLIDEVDIARVHEGQKVVVILDAYRDQPFDAKVTRILPHKDSRSQTFTAEAVFTSPPARLYDGLSGEANIIISRRENVLTLPTELIGPDKLVSTPDGNRRVETGISDLRFTEIISGLDTSTVVYQTK
ncbi:efflux RND transporter periplasmic adaptor subunit [Neolewinella persica]|uniref:efflux RND transporter periplasmic adaptor subunit n=1 Tax=Neolewinella persica TaxID=70998 RepID=UPI00037FB325|nr:HlyD family efflux transporter periplasmic adaptor subunit [Neolewinella persica]